VSIDLSSNVVGWLGDPVLGLLVVGGDELRRDWALLWLVSLEKDDVDLRSLGGDDLSSLVVHSEVEGDGLGLVDVVGRSGSLDLDLGAVDDLEGSDAVVEFDSSLLDLVDGDGSQFLSVDLDDAILEVVEIDDLGLLDLVKLDFLVSLEVLDVPSLSSLTFNLSCHFSV